MNRLILAGCRPEPLAGYLKALGVLRLVAEQLDPHAKGAWLDGVFVLQTRLTESELVAFFLDSYVPTPVITPWNGGSGFWDGDNQAGIGEIRASAGSRFATYRRAVQAALQCLQPDLADFALRVSDARKEAAASGKKPKKPTAFPTDEAKFEFVTRLRATAPDDVLAWMDASLVLTDRALSCPPLLGTGGNDGHLDFAKNFMQRVAEELIGPPEGRVPDPAMLCGSLFARATVGLGEGAIGQFFPSAAGGKDSPGTGTNPWDYILLVEGAVCLATAVVRRIESIDGSAMAFPFSVRATAAGFGTAAAGESEGSRNELWLPLWPAFASWPELAAVFREGRSRVGRRAAITGTDFARSLASLGVDRGILAFTRYAFHVRNGLAYQAVPLGRWPVGTAPAPVAALLEDIDPWIVEVAGVIGKTTPARVCTAIRQLDDAIVAAVRPGGGPGEVQRVLLALAEVEATTADSKEHAGLRHPVPALDGSRWLALLNDGTPEFDLAASLAVDLRRRWSAVRRAGDRWSWADGAESPPPASRVWRRGPLVSRLLDLIQREQVEASGDAGTAGGFDDRACWYASVDAVLAFIESRSDDARIVDLARALSLLSWPKCDAPPVRRRPVPALFAAARVLVGGAALAPDGRPFPPVVGWVPAARREDGRGFTSLTWRRLAASGVTVRGLGRHTRAAMLRDGDDVPVRRLAAACRFPLSPSTLHSLMATLQPDHPELT